MSKQHSQLLSEAIVDAKALRESAMKSAEAQVLEAYKPRIAEAVHRLLELDKDEQDPVMGGDSGRGLPSGAANDAAPMPSINQAPEAGVGGLPLSTPDAGNLEVNPLDGAVDPMVGKEQTLEEPVAYAGEVEPSVDDYDPSSVEEEEVEIDLGGLKAAMDAEELKDKEDHEMLALDTLEGSTEEPVVMESARKGGDKNIESQEPLYEFDDSLLEELNLEMNTVASGAIAGGLRPSSQQKEELLKDSFVELNMNDDQREEREALMKELETLKESVRRLRKEKELIKKKSEKVNRVVEALSNKLIEANLLNAKLLYKNRAYSDPSMNERQRKVIAEAIGKADSPVEAKRIYEATSATFKAGPSRNEAGTKDSLRKLLESRGATTSVISETMRNAKEEKEDSGTSVAFERWKRLAGLAENSKE